MPFIHSGRLMAALAVLCAALLYPGCATKRVDATTPAPTATPYQRLATYNAIVAEANKAAVEAVRSAAELQMIPPALTQQIFAWQERVALTNKALAVALSNTAVDVRSAEITNLVLQLAAPPVFDTWLTAIQGDQQKLLIASLKALSAVVTAMVREFALRQGAGLYLAPLHPARANVDAWLSANDVEVALRVTPREGRFAEFAALWRREHGYVAGGGR